MNLTATARSWSLLFALGLMTTPRAYAQEATRDDARARTRAAAAAGALMHYGDSPATQTHRAAFHSQAGYGGARGNGTLEGRAELVLLGGPRRARGLGLSLLGGASYASPGTRADYAGQARVAGTGGLKLQPLFQDRHVIDAAISVSYVAYGQSFANGDRYGRLRAASLTRVVDELRLGFDGRASVDLGREDDTPGEAAFELAGGTFASYALPQLLPSLALGPSILRFSDKPSQGGQRSATLIGFALSIGVGTAL